MSFLRLSANSIAIALSCVAVSPAFAADDLYVTVGAKVWSNKWTSWDYYAPIALNAVQSLPGASENFSSSSQASFIPSLTMRYGDFMVTGSLFAKKDYGFTGSDGKTFTAKRDETDLHGGYFVLPTLAVTLGYKDVKQDFGPGREFKYSGPIIGLAGSAPLTQGFSLYGNFGYGSMKADFPKGFTDNNGKNSLNADYYLGEVGLAYSFDAKSIFPSAKALTATLGYRNQTISTQNFAVGVDANNPSRSRSTELRDNTEGLSLGLSVTF